MKYINYSEHESNLTNLRIGRTDILKSFDIEQLTSEIFDLNLDLCRLKVDISNTDVFNVLNKLNFLYSNYSFIIEQKLELDDIDINNYPIDLDVRLYNGSQKEALYNLVRQVQVSDGFNVYYKNDIIDELLPKYVIDEIVATYQTTFDNRINKNKYCFLAYKNNILIGFCTLQINNKESDAVFVGILPEYRSKDLFKYFVNQQIVKSKMLGVKSYICKTIAFNSRSLNTTLKQGLKINRLVLNINIVSLLNYKKEIISFQSSTESIIQDINKKLNELQKNSLFIKEYKLNKNSKCILNVNIFKNLKYIVFFNKSKEVYGYAIY